MHPLVKNTIKFFLFLAVSAFLFWLVYRDQNWDELLTVLKEDVNYFWIGVACVMGIASHVSRALRWQLLTASMVTGSTGETVTVAETHLWGIGFLSGIVLWG